MTAPASARMSTYLAGIRGGCTCNLKVPFRSSVRPAPTLAIKSARCGTILGLANLPVSSYPRALSSSTTALRSRRLAHVLIQLDLAESAPAVACHHSPLLLLLGLSAALRLVEGMRGVGCNVVGEEAFVHCGVVDSERLGRLLGDV